MGIPWRRRCRCRSLGKVSILIAVIVPLFNVLAVVVLEVFRGQKPKPLYHPRPDHH